MTQSQITTISRSLTERVQSLVLQQYPNPKKAIDANDEIARAIINGRKVTLRKPADILQAARDKIAGERYSSSRTFAFTDIFESSAEVKAAQQAADTLARKREKLEFRLHEVRTKVQAECKLGRFDTEQSAALDRFDELAAAVIEKEKK